MAIANNTDESNNNDAQYATKDIAPESHASSDGVKNQPSVTRADKSLQLKKKRMLILAAVAVLLGILFFAPIIPRPLPNPSELQPITLNDISLSTKFESPQELIQKSVEDLGGMVREAADNYGSYGVDANGLAVFKLPYRALNGDKFSVQPTEGYGIAFDGDLDQSDVNYQKLVQFFNVNNFVEIYSNEGETIYIGEDKLVNFKSYAAYVSGRELCAIWNANISEMPEVTWRVSIGCTTLANYEKAADAVAPFHDTYSKTDGKHDSQLVYGAPEIAKGANGYQRAALYQEDSLGTDQANSGNYAFQAIYYKAPNSKTWVYFGRVAYEGDEMIECSKINTDPLRQAFDGIACQDTATKKNSVIRTTEVTTELNS